MNHRLLVKSGRPSRHRRAPLPPVPRQPVFDHEAFKLTCRMRGWTRQAFRERSGLSLTLIDGLRSGRVKPSPAVSFRLALALPEEDLRAVFGGDPRAQRPPARRYDVAKDQRLRSWEPLALDDGRVVQAAVFSYDGGPPKLRVTVQRGSRPATLVARVALHDTALAAHVVGVIADAVFPAAQDDQPAEVTP